jgi:4-hydroxythreonine-4-phosphate dehydrogenase
MGDPAGIGGEISLRAWQALQGGPQCFVVLDDPDRLTELARAIGGDLRVRAIDDIAAAAGVFPEALPVLPVRLAVPAVPGRPDKANARAVIASIERATDLALHGAVGGVVTNPINKAALYDAGFEYPGHTEFLAALTGVPGKQIMMLVSPCLRVVPVTVHLSLRDALASLTTEKIDAAARPTHAALQDQRGVAACASRRASTL